MFSIYFRIRSLLLFALLHRVCSQLVYLMPELCLLPFKLVNRLCFLSILILGKAFRKTLYDISQILIHTFKQFTRLNRGTMFLLVNMPFLNSLLLTFYQIQNISEYILSFNSKLNLKRELIVHSCIFHQCQKILLSIIATTKLFSQTYLDNMISPNYDIILSS